MSVNTSKKTSEALHKTAQVILSVPRAAFLLIVRINVWGLAKVMYDSYTYYNKDLLSKLQIGWYNLGGSWSALADSISKGYNRKPVLLKLAPKKIKDVYAKLNVNIGALEPVGIGEITVAAAITSAAAIISALYPLLELFFNIAAKTDELPEYDPESDDFDFDSDLSDLEGEEYDDLLSALRDEDSGAGIEFRTMFTKEEADKILADIASGGVDYYDIPPPSNGSDTQTNSGSTVNSAAIGWIAAGLIILAMIGSVSSGSRRKNELI